jgi:hypothetical protein
MRNIIFLFLIPALLKSQDTTSKKVISHEIGFNTVSLIKQVISNDPGNTLTQSPYDFVYNLMFHEKIGIRVGLGVNNSRVETDIEGQFEPRITNRTGLNGRIGGTYNILKQNRVTLNAFADFLYSNSSVETVNTTTMSVFPNPVLKITTTTEDKVSGMGGQVGVGVKYSFHKHLALYAEFPFSVVKENIKSEVIISEQGAPDDKSASTSSVSSMQFILPATIYLILNF